MISHCRRWNFPEQTATSVARGKRPFQDAASVGEEGKVKLVFMSRADRFRES